MKTTFMLLDLKNFYAFCVLVLHPAAVPQLMGELAMFANPLIEIFYLTFYFVLFKIFFLAYNHYW